MKDYKSPYQTFNFDSWAMTGNRLEFNYSFDDALHFTEVLEWPEGTVLPDSEVFNNVANLYHILAGTSYYKLYPTKELKLKNGNLDRAQADFFEDVYRQGFGEYLYVNQLNPNIIGRFVDVKEEVLPTATKYDGKGAVVMVGGGKDSLVTIDLLKKGGKDFSTFRVNSSTWVDRQLEKIGAPNSTVKRLLDSKLVRNEFQDSLNGHVPVTAMVSTAAVLDAVINGRSTIVASSEASSDIPNVEYAGMQINHQFSKSLELETKYANYLKEYVGSTFVYFSLLRPWTMLKIVEYFSNNIFDEYSGLWSSSNDNFKLGNNQTVPSWDVHYSPKTLSVFGLFAAFIKPEKLIPEMGGDYFEPDEFSKTWNELVGNVGVKPLECVADVDEMRLAIKLAQENGWENAKKIKVGEPTYDYKTNREHRIPDEYKGLVE